MATTRSRSRQRSAEIKRFSLSLSIISRMASTWPCGRDFCVVNRSCGETRGSSRSTRRKVSILSGGQSERLATVRLRVFWPSRQASRRRTAGGELRLGTTSMYMGALDHNNYTLSSINLIKYMGAYWRSRDGTMHTFPTVYPRIQPLLLLELRSRGGADPITRPLCMLLISHAFLILPRPSRERNEHQGRIMQKGIILIGSESLRFSRGTVFRIGKTVLLVLRVITWLGVTTGQWPEGG